ncbi:MAG: major capsid protein [Smithella sp.]
MPRPTPTTTIQRPDLGAIAYEYAELGSDRGYIAGELLPIFETLLQTSTYPVIPLETILKLQETERAPRGNYNRSDYQFEDGYYATKDRGWEELLDDVEAAMYRRYFDAEEVATKRCVDIILRAREARVAAKLMNTTNIPATSNVAIPWSTPATATPRANVIAAKTAMRAASGLTPNAIAMAKAVFDAVMLTKEIMDAFRYTNPIEIGGEEAQQRILAQYFGVDRILVGNSIKDGAKKGQSSVIADIWDDEYILLAKVSNGGQDLREPCLGRTFLWTEDSPDMLVTEQYRAETNRSEVYRVRNNTDEAFIFTGAGYLLGNIIDP